MKTSWILQLSAGLLLLSCSLGAAPPPRTTAVADPRFLAAIETSRAALLSLLKERPGLSVTVSIGGTIVWSEGAGWADVEAKRPVTSATRFRIYSNAKPLTATLALRLARQKRLDLDAPIGTWLHDLPPATAAITMRQLLGQMGGIRHYGSNEWMSVSRGHCKAAVEGLSPFIKDPLLAAPGAAWSYSSFGYVLASAAIEAATGEPFYALLEKEVFVPAQMADTKPDARSIADATAYDSASFGRRVVAPSVDNSCKFGAGGLVGTSDDLARFASHLMDGTLLDADSRKEMTAITVGADAKPTAYGLGVGIATDPELGTIFAHSGGSLGGRSYLLANPEHQLVVALGSNLEGESFRKQAYDIAKAFAKSPRVTNRE